LKQNTKYVHRDTLAILVLMSKIVSKRDKFA
jgi:hypothetical protein